MENKRRDIDWSKLLGLIVITELIGFLGGWFGGIVKLGNLNLWANWIVPTTVAHPKLFMFIWPALYLLMAIAAYLAWVEAREVGQHGILTFYWIQLALNFLWPIVFFRYRQLWFAVAVMVALLICAVIAMIRFRPYSKAAFWLMAPYVIWLIYALYLNWHIAMLNR